MSKKYKILESDFILVDQMKLYRIQATKSFSNIQEGGLGGFIQTEKNLSQDGDALVYGGAQVSGKVVSISHNSCYGNFYGNFSY